MPRNTTNTRVTARIIWSHPGSWDHANLGLFARRSGLVSCVAAGLLQIRVVQSGASSHPVVDPPDGMGCLRYGIRTFANAKVGCHWVLMSLGITELD
jgi:hypothetical protein